jgi:hypothetical protein
VQAIGKHIKKAALASRATHLARINREIGHQIKLAARLAAAGKLKAKPASKPKEADTAKVKKAAP